MLLNRHFVIISISDVLCLLPTGTCSSFTYISLNSHLVTGVQVCLFMVAGRKTPTEKDPEPELYRMKLFSENEVAAKSRFWYFSHSHKLRTMKKTTGDILAVKEVGHE